MSIIRLRELKEQNCSGCNNRLATVTEETEIKFQTPFETTLKSIKSGLTILNHYFLPLHQIHQYQENSSTHHNL